MEQQNRFAIIVLARGGNIAKDIANLTKPPKATVYRVFKWFKEEFKIERKEHKTQSDVKSTPKFLDGLKRLIEANLPSSMATFAKKHNVSVSTVFRDVIWDLGMISYVRHLLTAKAIWAEICLKLLLLIKHQVTGKSLVFVDEKKFKVDAEVNHRIFRVIAC